MKVVTITPIIKCQIETSSNNTIMTPAAAIRLHRFSAHTHLAIRELNFNRSTGSSTPLIMYNHVVSDHVIRDCVVWWFVVSDHVISDHVSGSFVDKVPHCVFFLRINKSQFSLIFSGSGDLYIWICPLSTPSSADLPIYHRIWGC